MKTIQESIDDMYIELNKPNVDDLMADSIFRAIHYLMNTLITKLRNCSNNFELTNCGECGYSEECDMIAEADRALEALILKRYHP